MTDILDSQIWVADTGGGGGHGDPKTRNPKAVLSDVVDGFVSLQKARLSYGVVVNTTSKGYEIDEDETKALRSEV